MIIFGQFLNFIPVLSFGPLFDFGPFMELDFLDKIWTFGIVCTALEERHFRVPLITLNGCDAVSLMDITLCVKELQRLITMTHCIFWPENQSKIVSKYGLKKLKMKRF